MKKAALLFLYLALLMTLCACGEKPAEPVTEPAQSVTEPEPAAPAAEPEPKQLTIGETPLETVQAAIIEVCKAFYNKNPYMQYDWGELTFEGKVAGAPHRSAGQSPEDTAQDTHHYSQCSEFCWDVYYEALGYRWLGGDHTVYGNTIYKEPYSSAIIMSYDEKLGTHDDRDARIAEMMEKIDVGDIVFAYGLTGSGEANRGHLMVCVGDLLNCGEPCLAHIWPIGSGSTNMTTGQQFIEPKGGCAIQPISELLLNEYPTGSEPFYGLRDISKGGDHFMLLRPYLMEDCKAQPMPLSTLTRLKYPDLVLTKTADRFIYHDVREGENLVITEVIESRGTVPFTGLPLTEYVPEGAELVSADSACTVDGSTLHWTLDVPAGGSVTVTYTVKNNLKMGETLVFPAGSAEDLPTRTMSFPVGGKQLSASQNAALKAIADGTVPKLLTEEYRNFDFVNEFYKQILGAEIDLPKTVNDLISTVTQKKNNAAFDTKMLVAKAADKADARIASMVIPRSVGGWYYSTGIVNHLRMLSILEEYFVPGDVVVAFGGELSQTSVLKDADADIFIYLGSGKVLTYNTRGAAVQSFSATIGSCFKYNFFMGLRPTMGIADLSAAVELPQKSTAEAATEEELAALLAAKETEILVTKDLTLTAPQSGKDSAVTIKDGCRLTLGGWDLTCRTLTAAKDGIAAETGRVKVTSGSEEDDVAMLAAYEGMPVYVTSSYGDICNTYDCLAQVGYFNGNSSNGAKNAAALFKVVPAGWTVVLNGGLVSSGTVSVTNPGVTLDLHGKSFGMNNFGTTDLKVIDSVGGAHLTFRGKPEGGVLKVENVLDLSGIELQLGFNSAASSTSNFLTLEVRGKLICKNIVCLNGSEFRTVGSGEIIYQ